MAFSQTNIGTTVFGNKRIAYGTFDGDGATTGELTTPLKTVEALIVSAVGSSVVADAPTVNETFPNSNAAQTLIFTSGTDGMWFAIGT